MCHPQQNQHNLQMDARSAFFWVSCSVFHVRSAAIFAAHHRKSLMPEQNTPETEALQFTNVAALYDLLMTGVPYDDWVTYIEELLESRNAAPKRVLDLACGTGNVSVLLAEKGYEVTGVDIAADMIEAARQKPVQPGWRMEFFNQDAAEMDLGDRRFDLCISLFDSLNYITDPQRLQMAFHRIAHHLEEGALLIFDVNSEYALKNRFFDQDNRDYPEERLMYDWKSVYDEKTRICRVYMAFWYREDDGTTREFKEVHVQFAYKAPELVAMLETAGFTDISTYQAYTMRMPGRTADRLYFVARKG